MKLISGNSNHRLSEKISQRLASVLAHADIRTFKDGEVFVEIQENVRGEDVFVIQSTSYPANDHLMELLITIDALTRASASRVTAVIGRAEAAERPSPDDAERSWPVSLAYFTTAGVDDLPNAPLMALLAHVR